VNATRPVIALLTDFGTVDPFVGVMKGVILSRCPDATLVDLTHGVTPQSVTEGAFLLERSHRFFPGGCVFVAVVDPGVGTARRAVVIRAHGRLFVGPDNGLLASTVSTDSRAEVFEIDPARLGLSDLSRTFHGRDLFAPVSAELAAGRISPSDVGPRLAAVEPSDRRVPLRREDRVEGAVVTIDRFGNLITNIDVETMETLYRPFVEVAGLSLPLRGTYGDVEDGEYVALIDAYDVLEIARRNGDAARTLGVTRGAPVTVRRS